MDRARSMCVLTAFRLFRTAIHHHYDLNAVHSLTLIECRAPARSESLFVDINTKMMPSEFPKSYSSVYFLLILACRVKEYGDAWVHPLVLLYLPTQQSCCESYPAVCRVGSNDLHKPSFVFVSVAQRPHGAPVQPGQTVLEVQEMVCPCWPKAEQCVDEARSDEEP